MTHNTKTSLDLSLQFIFMLFDTLFKWLNNQIKIITIVKMICIQCRYFYFQIKKISRIHVIEQIIIYLYTYHDSLSMYVKLKLITTICMIGFKMQIFT